MPTSRAGVVHLYSTRLNAFEHNKPTNPPTPPQNLLIFIGGLFDGLLTVPYPNSISDALPPTWSLAQIHLSSSYTGWGTSSLQKDVTEISRCVTYFRGIKTGKIVLMGHSTGCQDVMEYLTGAGHQKRAKIDGGIIQAPASDREAIVMDMDPDVYKKSCEAAQAMVAKGDGNEILQFKEIRKTLPAPVSAKRWLSLASPNHDGPDDYFSSDLTDAQLMKSFAKLPKEVPLCVLFSGSDEYVPPTVDKEAVLKRWIEITKTGEGKLDEVNSGIMEGASHNLAGNPDEVVQGLVKRVLGFLDTLPVDRKGEIQ